MTNLFLPRVKAMIQELTQTAGLRVHRAEVGPPASVAALSTARNYAGYRLPAGVAEFYGELNGLEVAWESEDGKDRGAIALLPVERIFGNWKEAIWFDDFPGGDRFRPVKPFDFFQPEACAAFYQKSGDSAQETVYFHVVGEELCATGYTFPEYIERMLACRGYLYWSLTLCSETQANPEVAAFRARIPRLFPDCPLELFRPGQTAQNSAPQK